MNVTASGFAIRRECPSLNCLPKKMRSGETRCTSWLPHHNSMRLSVNCLLLKKKPY
jgi:hypothetical protein